MGPSIQAFLAALASFFFFTLIWAFVYFLCLSRKFSSSQNPSPQTLTRTIYPQISIDFESATFDPSIERISMDSLKILTHGFSSDLIIGDGSFGLVYKATLPSSGVTVAIKKLAPDAFHGFREFKAEMETLGKLRHKNIVKMLGYCFTSEDRALIYEYMENGSLDHWLHGGDSPEVEGEVKPMNWELRCKIMKEVANGLRFLHGLEKPIIHRDIKASNVLLDSNFEAHISDFGLARAVDTSRSHVTTQVAGTLGYMPPEYWDGVTTTTVKADVYSYGILMLEVATGIRPNLPIVVEGKEVGLIQWATKMAGRDRHMDTLDCAMEKGGLCEEKVRGYFAIALSCTNEKMRERPSIIEICELFEHYQI